MKCIVCLVICGILVTFAPESRASDELCCIGDYNMKGADEGFYWFTLDLKMDGPVVERLSWETSYACDRIPKGQECRVDAAGFSQTVLKDATIELRDPDSKCVMRLKPQKKERGSYLLEADGCREKFCVDKGVLIPITIRMRGRKCIASPVHTRR
jgi:hypothetical protein